MLNDIWVVCWLVTYLGLISCCICLFCLLLCCVDWFSVGYLLELGLVLLWYFAFDCLLWCLDACGWVVFRDYDLLYLRLLFFITLYVVLVCYFVWLSCWFVWFFIWYGLLLACFVLFTCYLLLCLLCLCCLLRLDLVFGFAVR